MIKVKSRMPEVASERIDAASSFIDHLRHDKALRRKLRAAGKASTAAGRRAQTQARRGGITSLATDPVLKDHIRDALAQLQAARRTQKRPEHRARNVVALLAGAMIVATLKLRHTLGGKPSDETDNPEPR